MAAPALQTPGPSVASRHTCVLSTVVASARGQSHLVGMEFTAFLRMTSEVTQSLWAQSQKWDGGSMTATAVDVSTSCRGRVAETMSPDLVPGTGLSPDRSPD